MGSSSPSINQPDPDVNSSSTIAAIVTSLGGQASAVGIVRLSGASAVNIAGRVFRPLKKRKKKNFSWQPTSHVVEYGVVCDPYGNVVDEVNALSCFLLKTGLSVLICMMFFFQSLNIT